MQALSAAEQGEKDPLGRTSSTISLQLIMQSEAAGMFNHPQSGKEGHAMLAATVAKMQSEHEASQEAAIQQHVLDEADNAAGLSQDESGDSSSREELSQSRLQQQNVQSHSWDQAVTDSPGLNRDGPHDAPAQVTGMHSGELIMSATPILGSGNNLADRNS